MKTYPDYEEIQVIKQKQIASGSMSIKWIDDDECLYRGRVICRHDNVPVGYGGRYSIKDKSLRHSFSKMADAKLFIDAQSNQVESNNVKC